MKAVHELEALISNYKAIVTALEKDLKDARANPIVSEDTQAKQKLLAELERERDIAGARLRSSRPDNACTPCITAMTATSMVVIIPRVTRFPALTTT